jgi:hypothetical protein
MLPSSRNPCDFLAPEPKIPATPVPCESSPKPFLQFLLLLLPFLEIQKSSNRNKILFQVLPFFLILLSQIPLINSQQPYPPINSQQPSQQPYPH